MVLLCYRNAFFFVNPWPGAVCRRSRGTPFLPGAVFVERLFAETPYRRNRFRQLTLLRSLGFVCLSLCNVTVFIIITWIQPHCSCRHLEAESRDYMLRLALSVPHGRSWAGKGDAFRRLFRRVHGARDRGARVHCA